jgi:ParB/Sulfiredoxin domain
MASPKNPNVLPEFTAVASEESPPASSTARNCVRVNHQVVSTRLNAVKPNPRNARTHSKKQIAQIAESIKEFGFTSPVLTDETGMLIAGHGRIEAARLLGLKTVPTIAIAGLSEAKKRALLLADNKIAQNAGWVESNWRLSFNRYRNSLPLKTSMFRLLASSLSRSTYWLRISSKHRTLLTRWTTQLYLGHRSTARIPAHLREISGSTGTRGGGPGRTRTSNQAVMSRRL